MPGFAHQSLSAAASDDSAHTPDFAHFAGFGPPLGPADLLETHQEAIDLLHNLFKVQNYKFLQSN